MAEEAIDKFYKLKGSYDSKYRKAKNNIRGDEDASLEEKRRRTSAILRKCVGCGRNVKTNFSTTNRELIATCGDETTPCGLDIKIQLGTYKYLPTLIKSINSDINIAKLDINRIKLNLLFGLVSEEDMVENFEKTKETYKSQSVAKNVVDEALESLRFVEVDDIGGIRRIKRTRLVEINQLRLGDAIGEFRQLMIDYEKNSGKRQEDNKRANIKDAIELYQTQILPISKIIRDGLYDINTVSHQGSKFELIQIKTAFDKLIFEIISPEIISNKK
jgi:hypothetical protein